MSLVWPKTRHAMAGAPDHQGPVLNGRWLLVSLCLFSAALYVAVLPGRLLDFGIPQQRFLSLHALLELISIVISLSLGLTASYTLGESGRRRYWALPIAFAMVAGFDVLHVLSYPGMPDLVSPNSTQKAILFWLLARLLAALTLLAWAAAWDLQRAQDRHEQRGRRLLVAVMLSTAGLSGGLALVAPEQFPAMFDADRGLTPLKQGLEGLVIALHLAALWLLQLRARQGQVRSGDAELRVALCLAVLGEAFFSLYSDRVTDMANAIGHVYKVLTYACLYRSLFIVRVQRPFALVAKAHEAAARRGREYRDLLELAPDGVLVTDREGRILMVNKALETMFGYRREQLIGQTMETLLPESLRARHRQHRSGYMAAPTGDAMRGRRGLRALHADGHEFDVEVALGMDAGGGDPRLTAYISDVSLRRKQDRELEYRATHDALTGLPNRWLFADRLRGAEGKAQPMALAVLDLDGFQALNEQQGTQAGDRLLRSVSAQLRQQLPDGATLARLGSDEFAILMPLQTQTGSDAEPAALAQAATGWAQGVAEQLRQVGSAGGLSLCMGLALRRPGREPCDLLGQAQMALQAAKGQGRGQILLYSEQLGERARRDARIEQRLRMALETASLSLHYQAQVDVASGKVQGFEALLRWDDAELGAVSPALFVPVAERAGLMPGIGAQVLKQACEQLQHWRQQGFHTRVAINLSPLQFRDESLAEQVVDALQRCELPSHCLCVEVTESAMMDDPAAAAAQLRRLAQAGIEAHLDDFGTGHSSLAWLRDFPIRSIKIDRSFVRDMLRDGNDDAIVRAVVGLAHTLGCTVVAEGVEQPAQLEHLRSLGCDTYQGWLFAKALPAKDARRLALAHGPV